MKILKQNNKSVFRKLLCTAFVFCIAILISCDKGFVEMNTNPWTMNEPDFLAVWTNVVYSTRGTGDNGTQYPRDKTAGAIVQWWSTLNLRQWVGVAYSHHRPDYYGGFWSTAYGGELRDCTELIHMTKFDPEWSNLHNICRIWRVFQLHRATDLYGDVPYSEAAMVNQTGVTKPKFDRQQEIYYDMLKELEEAAAALVDNDDSKVDLGATDLVYRGDILKWKKFAYSMMLRLGMRMTKVEPQTAETWVRKAILGGVMQSNADAAYFRHAADPSSARNQQTDRFDGVEVVPRGQQGKGYGKVAKTFVDELVSNYDPRCPFYITMWQGNRSGVSLADRELYSRINDQKGLPTGYDEQTIKLLPGWEDFTAPDSYVGISEPNLNTIGHRGTPTFFVRYAQIELLLAEAAIRGWGAPLSAQEHYERGVRGSMDPSYTSLFPGNYVTPESDIVAYLNGTGGDGTQGRPWDDLASFDRKMELIHTQFWIASYLDGLEAFANWRRTEYPKLTAPNYPGNYTGGTMPRRVPYNDTEISRNEDNWKQAISNQGWTGDRWTERMWWDKQ